MPQCQVFTENHLSSCKDNVKMLNSQISMSAVYQKLCSAKLGRVIPSVPNFTTDFMQKEAQTIFHGTFDNKVHHYICWGEKTSKRIDSLRAAKNNPPSKKQDTPSPTASQQALDSLVLPVVSYKIILTKKKGSQRTVYSLRQTNEINNNN